MEESKELKISKKDEKWLDGINREILSALASMEYFSILAGKKKDMMWERLYKNYPETEGKDMAWYQATKKIVVGNDL